MADSPAQNETTTATITLEREGQMLLIGLNRPHKRNAFTLEMLAELSRAYGLLESDDDLRVGVLFAHGEHFTGGLDLADVAPAVTSGKSPFPDEGRKSVSDRRHLDEADRGCCSGSRDHCRDRVAACG